MPEKQPQPHVVVTTAHRGVFGGYLEGEYQNGDENITLTDARMCVYWSVSVRGVSGLASKGPDSRCRISPSVPRITLTGITAVIESTDAAKDAWEAEPWSS